MLKNKKLDFGLTVYNGFGAEMRFRKTVDAPDYLIRYFYIRKQVVLFITENLRELS